VVALGRSTTRGQQVVAQMNRRGGTGHTFVQVGIIER
jgi:hypothetical protein